MHFELDYERKVTSQNGEDGILEYLIPYIKNNTFVEIGWADGVQNNCRNLLEQHNFVGHGIDILQPAIKHPNLTHVSKKIDLNSIDEVINMQGKEPGVFSLDIDSYDYHILKALLEKGFRPEIVVHEYNSVLGPDRNAIRVYGAPTNTKNHYGASLVAYKELLRPYYTFVTVETRGVNAFYIRNDIEFTMPSKTFEWRKISNMYGAGKRYDKLREGLNSPNIENGGWIDA